MTSCAGLVNAERLLIEIIRVRAWVPLGYATLAEAWEDRMDGVAMAEAVRVHAIYAAADDGSSRAEIIRTFLIKDSVVDSVLEYRQTGLPPEGYSIVREHQRRKDKSPSRILGVKFSASEYAYLQDLAKAQGFDLKEEARKAIWEHVGGLLSDG